MRRFAVLLASILVLVSGRDAAAQVAAPLVWRAGIAADRAAIRLADPGAWTIEETPVGPALALSRPARWSPPHVAPRGLALLPWRVGGDFRLELDLEQTGPAYAHRDLVIVFGFASPARFAYAHLSSRADARAHHLHVVAGADRRPVTRTRSAGLDWGRFAMRRLVLERRGDLLRVSAQDPPELLLEGEVAGFDLGWLGFGSFDDVGRFRRAELVEAESVERLPAPFLSAPRGAAALPRVRFRDRDFVAGTPRRLNDDAGWCWFQGPRALVVGSRLVVGTVANGALDGDRRGDIELSVVDLATGISERIELEDRLEADDHDAPGLLALPGGEVLAVWSRHGGDALKRSRRVVLGSPPRRGPLETVAPSPSSRVTYSNLVRLEAEGGRIYDVFRGLDGSWKPSFRVSEDDGRTWRRGGILIDVPGSVRHRPYVVLADDGEEAFHLFYTEGHPRDVDASVRHLVYRGGYLRRSDGEIVAPLEDGIASPELGTLVFQGGPDRAAWVVDAELNSAKEPRVLFTVQRDGAGLPPGRGGEDHRLHLARWRDGRWAVEELAFAGRRLYAGEDDYTGLAALDPGDPDVVWLSTDAHPRDGRPLVSRADGRRHHELFRGRRNPGGRFSWEPVTANSSADNLRPVALAGPSGETLLLWLRGRYRSYVDFEAELLLLRDPFPRPQVEVLASSASRADLAPPSVAPETLVVELVDGGLLRGRARPLHAGSFLLEDQVGPEGSSASVAAIDRDGGWLAFALDDGDGHVLVLAEAVEAGRWREVARSTERWDFADWPAIGPGARHLAIWSAGRGLLRLARRGGALVVTGAHTEGIKFWPRAAPVGDRLAWRSVLSADPLGLGLGVEGPLPTAPARPGFPEFSPDGRRWACRFGRGPQEGVLLSSGRELFPYAAVTAPIFSSNGESLVFRALDGDRLVSVTLSATW